MGEIERLKSTVERLERKVQELNIDAVTGIVGRRVLDRELGQQFARSRRFGRDVGMLMIDLDHFKKVNDDYGHQKGDEVLHNVAQVIAKAVRATDTVGRYGGEELVVCVDEAEHVRLFGERLRCLVSDLNVPGLPQVTVSIGYAISQRSDNSAEDTLKRADQALYRAKALGRNRIAC